MKHEKVVTQCEGCPKVVYNVHVEKVCSIYPNPAWIWEERYCPVKTRATPDGIKINGREIWNDLGGEE